MPHKYNHPSLSVSSLPNLYRRDIGEGTVLLIYGFFAHSYLQVVARHCYFLDLQILCELSQKKRWNPSVY
jgi:hypothetical protein